MAALQKYPRSFHRQRWTHVRWMSRKNRGICNAISAHLAEKRENQFQHTCGKKSKSSQIGVAQWLATFLLFYVPFWFVCFPEIRNIFLCLLDNIIGIISGSFYLSHSQITQTSNCHGYNHASLPVSPLLTPRQLPSYYDRINIINWRHRT